MMQIVSHTPVWVFFLFFGLLFFGLLQTRNRLVKMPAAYLLPIAMVALSFSGVQSGFGVKVTPLLSWFTGLVVVALGARVLFMRSAMTFDVKLKRFFIPGSWVPLAIIMSIFFTKFALAVIQARTAVPVGSGTAATLSLLLGGLSGYFAGRTLALIAVARNAQHSVRADA